MTMVLIVVAMGGNAALRHIPDELSLRVQSLKLLRFMEVSDEEDTATGHDLGITIETNHGLQPDDMLISLDTCVGEFHKLIVLFNISPADQRNST